MKHVKLAIEGMHCSACANSLQKALSKLIGLRNVSVDFETRTASFDYDDDEVTMDDIIETVDNCGFHVKGK